MSNCQIVSTVMFNISPIKVAKLQKRNPWSERQLQTEPSGWWQLLNGWEPWIFLLLKIERAKYVNKLNSTPMMMIIAVECKKYTVLWQLVRLHNLVWFLTNKAFGYEIRNPFHQSINTPVYLSKNVRFRSPWRWLSWFVIFFV